MSQAVISIALAASDVFSILSKKAPFRLDLRPQGPASFRRLEAHGIQPVLWYGFQLAKTSIGSAFRPQPTRSRSLPGFELSNIGATCFS